MGYYSDVVLVLNPKGLAKLRKRLADPEKPEKIRQSATDFFKYADQHLTNKKAEAWFWDGVKWYSNDPEYSPEVYFIEDFLLELKENEYRFLRIGEDYDDVEVKGYFLDDPFGVNLSRQIRINS